LARNLNLTAEGPGPSSIEQVGKFESASISFLGLSNPKVLKAASFGESDAIYGENLQAAVHSASGNGRD
jgi:hypothetical protein